MEFFGPYSNSNVPSILLRRSYGAEDTHNYRSMPAAAEEEEEELDGFVMVKPRIMEKQLKSSRASYQSKSTGAFPRATAAAAAMNAVVGSSAFAGSSQEGSSAAAAPAPLHLMPTSTETPEDEKVKDPDVWKRTPEEEAKLYKILNGPIPPPPASTTFVWPPTEEEEAVIQQVLYRASGRSRLPAFSQICPGEGQAAPDSPSVPMQSCMQKK